MQKEDISENEFWTVEKNNTCYAISIYRNGVFSVLTTLNVAKNK